MAEITNKQYLGDGVYAAMEHDYQMLLTTEDGVSTTNRIVFEPETLLALMDYMCTTPALAAIVNAHLRRCPEAP